jgi:pimeloyl-[acyl-carrier protein] methyl ester esterase
MHAAPRLFPGWQATAFNHHLDTAEGGVEGLAQRALPLLQAHAAPQFVCGESFGGTVALTLAHVAPERVSGLILLSTFGWHPSTLARRGAGALALWTFLGGRVGTSVYRAGRFFSLPSQLGFHFPHELFQSYITRPRSDVAAYRAKAELSLTFDARPWLATIQCPVFILVGTWDPVVPPVAGRELARRMPRATLRTLNGGHLVHLVHAEEVGRLISEWVDNSC